MNNIEQRLYRLEHDSQSVRRLLDQILARLARVEQQQYGAGGFGFGGGGSSPDLWCRLSGSLGPATGAWPSITATSTTADVYKGAGSGLTLVATGATVRNRRNVTWAAGKTTNIAPAADGDGYVIVDQDC